MSLEKEPQDFPSCVIFSRFFTVHQAAEAVRTMKPLVLENKGKSWHSSSCHPSKPSGVLRALASLLPPCTQEGPSLSFSAFPGQLMSLPLPPETRALRAPKAAV